MKDKKGLKLIIIFFTVFNFIISIHANEIGIVEKLSATIPDNIVLTNLDGKSINLVDEIDIPTILTFVYFDCPGVCTPLMNEISSIIDKSDLVLGKDYQFITISFDPSEGTAMANEKKANYLKTMVKKDEAVEGWKFFTGDSLNIAKVTDAAGFYFSKAGTEYIHKTAMIFVNSKGKIIRYNQGINLLPLELKMTILEGEKGNTLPGIYKKDEYCYPFYVDAYQNLNDIAKIFGIIIISLAGVLFLYLVLKPLLKNKQH